MAHSITIVGRIIGSPEYVVYKGREYCYFNLEDSGFNKFLFRWRCYVCGDAVKTFRLFLDKRVDLMVTGHLHIKRDIHGQHFKVLVEWFSSHPEIDYSYVRWNSHEEMMEILEYDKYKDKDKI